MNRGEERTEEESEERRERGEERGERSGEEERGEERRRERGGGGRTTENCIYYRTRPVVDKNSSATIGKSASLLPVAQKGRAICTELNG